MAKAKTRKREAEQLHAELHAILLMLVRIAELLEQGKHPANGFRSPVGV